MSLPLALALNHTELWQQLLNLPLSVRQHHSQRLVIRSIGFPVDLYR